MRQSRSVKRALSEVSGAPPWRCAFGLFGLFLAAGAWSVACGGTSHKRLPNIVLVTLDTTRADRLGCYGYAGAETPNLDRLAAEGILFERAFAQVPMTLPSHASLLTGLYPPRHGLRLNGFYRLSNAIPTLPEELQRRGYATGAFVSARVLYAKFGLDRGFDHYDDDLVDQGLEAKERRGSETLLRALAWLDQLPPGPFFLWVHLFDPHMDYDPPEPYRTRFSDRPYDGEIAYADAVIGELREHLTAVGQFETTLLIVTADHGEGLGEHGEQTHALLVYDATLRVPLILRWPDAVPGRPPAWTPGRRIDANVQTVDLVPTIAGALGLNWPGALDGQSLLTNEGRNEAVLYGESWYPLSFGWFPLRSARHGPWKWIEAPEPELYDLAVDPGETTNRLSANPEIADWLRQELSRIPTEAAALAVSLDRGDLQGLRALGYVGGSRPETVGLDFGNLPDPKTRLPVFDAVNAARAFSEAGFHDRAIRLLDPWKEQEANNPVYLHVLGKALIGGRRFEEGTRILSRYAALAPDDLEAPMTLAKARIDQGQPAEAVPLLRGLLDRWPNDGAVFGLLSVALGMIGRYEEALQAGERSVELEPHLADHHKNRGLTLYHLGRLGEAEAALRRALDLNPQSTDYLFHLGLILNAQERFEASAPVFRSVLAADPGHVPARERLIVALYHLGRLDQVRALGQELPEPAESAPLGRLYLGRVQYEAGELEAALDSLEAAVRGLPTFPTGYLLMGRALLEGPEAGERAAWLLDRAAENGVELPPELAAELKERRRQSAGPP